MNIVTFSGSPKACDVLVFAAHPDDAELLCGGTLAKSVSAGQRVVVVDITEGELSSNGTLEKRREERKEATRILGLSDRVQLGRQDGALSRDEELLFALVQTMRLYMPKVIIGPPPICRHPDHQALHDALKQAHFFCGVKKYLPSVVAIDRPLHLKMLEVSEEKADLLIDISEHWETRMEAVMAYESQFGVSENSTPTFINSGFVESLERRYRECGERIGVRYAEPFLCTQPPEINLPIDLVK